MKNAPLYEKTVGILVDAYVNDTLVHGNCHACAVGNIVAANMGYTYKKHRGRGLYSIGWGHLNFYHGGVEKGDLWIGAVSDESPIRTASPYTDKGRKQVESTGYSAHDLAMIEYAFENIPFCEDEDEYMFNGLMAVIEALDQIHENTDSEVTATTKKRFAKVLTPSL